MVLLIVSACSGTGKSTLIRRLLARCQGLDFSVSTTTRAPRSGERETVDYHFVDHAEFLAMRARGELAEWAEYAGNFYGTSRSTIARAAASGRHLLTEIEIAGARSLKAAYPEAISVFILPPSWEELERRLRRRGTEEDCVVVRRLQVARREIEAAIDFDFLVVNDDLEQATDELVAIYQAARLRTSERRALLDTLS